MKRYNIEDLTSHVDGVYSDSFINRQLISLLQRIGEVEGLRGNEPTFDDLESVAGYYSSLLGEYSEKVDRLLMGTLEIKTLASQIFGSSPEIVGSSKEGENNDGEEKRISLKKEFRKGFAKRGLEGEELEKSTTSCTTYYRQELAQYLRSEGRKLFVIDYDAFVKARNEIIESFLKRKNNRK